MNDMGHTISTRVSLQRETTLSRRELLRRSGTGFGALALAGVIGRENLTAARSDAAVELPTAASAPHHASRAQHVIHIYLNGGMSQVDTFDPKPELTRRAGQMLPFANLQTERQTGTALASPFRFSKHGQSGIEVSEIFPHLAQCVDEMAVVRSMYAQLSNHELSLLLMSTGDQRLVRPSIGSWVTYGMGTENENMPGFIVLCPQELPVAGADNWRSAFLPGIYQGTLVHTKETSPEKLIRNLRNKYLGPAEQRDQLELLQTLNRRHLEARHNEAALESRIHSFELAYRMQLEATDAFDTNQEPEHIHRLYGEGVQNRQLLVARRLVERGVRFVQVWHGTLQPWDSHKDIEEHRTMAGQCDQGLAALIIDLKQRGMLDKTLIVCSGEFGRTPTVEMNPAGGAATLGRDHNHWGFSLWMAGGGIQGGKVYGATDEFGFQAVENRVSVHDLHATMLHLLGFDHEQLTYRHAGRDFRLTDVHGRVVTDLLA